MRSRVIMGTWIVAAASAAQAQYGAEIFADGFESQNTSAWRSDETRLRDLIGGPPPAAGTVDTELELVSRRGGLPLHTLGGTWLFVARCTGGPLGLAGDFNGWIPEAMTQNGAVCSRERTIAVPLEAGYRFVDGIVEVADPWARRYRYESEGELSLVAANAAHLERWPSVGPDLGLLPRQLRVWVPVDGIFDHVLYAQDGQNLFDPQAFFGGWQLDDALPAEMLAVGIDNTADRFAEYTPFTDDLGGGPIGGGGAAYADLVHTIIRPFVSRNYGGAPSHGLLGSSLGGLIALYIAERFPGAYDLAASLSGTLGWGSIGPHNETILESYAAAGHGTTAIYIDSGGGGTCEDSDGDGINDDGDDSDNYCTNAQMNTILLASGYQAGVDLWYVWDSGAAGNEAEWGGRVAFPLQRFAEQ